MNEREERDNIPGGLIETCRSEAQSGDGSKKRNLNLCFKIKKIRLDKSWSFSYVSWISPLHFTQNQGVHLE
jgi:hypothetical protein